MKTTSDTIKELELSLLQPEVRSSRETLDRLLADDFFEIGSSGNTYTKLDILERLPNTTESYKYAVTDFTVEISSENIATTTFKTVRTRNGKDKVVSERISRWRNTNGNWQIFFHEAKRIDGIDS